MSDYPEEEYLQLSGLQHFAFCKRQWALIHIERLWAENVRTVEGEILHERAHDPEFTQKRGDLLISRDMPVFSRRLGISGQCDVVEFHASQEGVPLFGREGTWLVRPVEYKRGAPKAVDADRLQLCAQAICLEEMLLCPTIGEADLFYGQTRRREKVPLTAELRGQVEQMLLEMHKLYAQRYTPRIRPRSGCGACSLKEQCLPSLLSKGRSAREYIDEQLGEMG